MRTPLHFFSFSLNYVLYLWGAMLWGYLACFDIVLNCFFKTMQCGFIVSVLFPKWHLSSNFGFASAKHHILQIWSRFLCGYGSKHKISTKTMDSGNSTPLLSPRSHFIPERIELKTNKCDYRRLKGRFRCERRPKSEIPTQTLRGGYNALFGFRRS